MTINHNQRILHIKTEPQTPIEYHKYQIIGNRVHKITKLCGICLTI